MLKILIYHLLEDLDIEDGCATITNFTAYLNIKGIEYLNSEKTKIIMVFISLWWRKKK